MVKPIIPFHVIKGLVYDLFKFNCSTVALLLINPWFWCCTWSCCTRVPIAKYRLTWPILLWPVYLKKDKFVNFFAHIFIPVFNSWNFYLKRNYVTYHNTCILFLAFFFRKNKLLMTKKKPVGLIFRYCPNLIKIRKCLLYLFF